MTDEKRTQIYVAVETLANAVNILGDKDEYSEEFASQLTRQHRTLQQGTWNLIFGAIKYYGECATADLRNQASVDACKKIAEFIEKEDIYLPTV